ncbi:MAG: OmpA family protein [Spirochaetales bacterium]|nr:OmpA family protein [Spirochaetales bacterium]
MKKWIFLLFVWSSACIGYTQSVEFEMVPGTRITYREVANLTRKIDNKYIGLVSKEEQGMLVTEDYGNTYKGLFFISRDLKHDARFVERPIEKTVNIEMKYNISTGFTVMNKSPNPRLQGFPVFPGKAVSPGEKWKAWSLRYVDPMNRNMPTAIRFYCEYQYEGPVNDNGRAAEKINARYALRYKNEAGNGDPELMEIKYAGHEVEIVVYDDDGSILIIDKIGITRGSSEKYIYSDGKVIEQSGTIITWLNAAVVMDRQKIINDFIDIAAQERKGNEIENNGNSVVINLHGEDIEVKEEQEGIKLELKNIHFKPDSNVILSSEKNRLDITAEMLKKVPERTILVIGHTARVGNIENEKELSEKRAKTIAAELIARGIPAKRFIYEGRGGNEPIGDNETEEGRKMNRRVEIIILEN